MKKNTGTFLKPFYIAVLLQVITFLTHGQVTVERKVLLGVVRNLTNSDEFEGIQRKLHASLSRLSQFPETELDSSLEIDSFPTEAQLMHARSLHAAYVMWGAVNIHEGALDITFNILDMTLGSMSHIRTTISGTESSSAAVEVVQAKLRLWLQRTSMAQLIITTTPLGSNVLLDDKKIGMTPFEGMIQPGTYRLTLSKSGSLPVTVPASFISGNTYQYDISLGSTEQKINKKAVVGWFGATLALFGAGALAHLQREKTYEKYHNAEPPADFNKLYRDASIWNISRDVLLGAGGVTLCVLVYQVVF